MATIKQMLEIANGSVEEAEIMAKFFIKDRGEQYLPDLQLLYALQGKIDESRKISEKVEKLFPNDDRVLYNKGWHSMLQGRLLEGFTLMNRGRNIELWGNTPIKTNKSIWDGISDLTNKHVLFNCEAGFGDEIAFVRFIKDITDKGAKVIVLCSEGLMSLFSRIPRVSSVALHGSETSIYHDYWIPSMLIPVLLKTQFEDLSGKPYLTVNKKYKEKFKKYINSDKLKVGIRWLGQSGDDYTNRIFPEELMFDSVLQEGVQVYSLQKDHSDVLLPKDIIDLEILLDTWEDTAGAIANLDLVITSCTSVAHLSAAMGKLTWVVTPLMMYYIWTSPGNKSPWYDSVILYRQEKYNEWTQPFDKIKKDLKKRI